MKKVWKKPKLVGIYRARPHEAVLTVCKNYNGGSDSLENDIACQQQLGGRGCECCDSCDYS
jgi:hypothetical protein